MSSKKLVAYVLSPLLFFAGDAVSRLMLVADVFGYLYPVYNKLMLASSDLEDWAEVSFMWSSSVE